MSKFPLAFLGLSVVAGTAHAQSLNVDFQPAGSLFGKPSSSYGAAAQSPGSWNDVSALSASNLVACNGAPTSVGLATNVAAPSFFGTFDHANTSGADEALLDDFHRPDEFFVAWSFSGLAPGEYLVTTISVSEFNALWVQISVPGSPDGVKNVSGSWSGSFSEGLNYSRHHKTVTDGTIRIEMQVVGFVDYAYFNGIQLVKTDLIGTPLCFGDGSLVACPCANNGAPGNGCENSAATGGARLEATGTLSPDTLVLHSIGELPSAPSIFLQGSAAIGSVPFGDGLRCAGGFLKRLYVKTASGGSVSAPEIGDLSITAQSAALGEPIPVGERRYYQVYYRDPDPVFCPTPTGNAFNASNAIAIAW